MKIFLTTYEISFNIFYLAQYIQNIIISTYNHIKITKELFYILSLVRLNLACILHLEHISIKISCKKKKEFFIGHL